MNRLFTPTLLLLLIASTTFSQSQLERPKLVVGLMLDQMRWDYLYRYYDRYSEKGGFKRLLKEGNTCENTLIPYSPSVTACGHSVVYTGSAPSITGITGNAWWDKDQNRTVYCTEDKSVATVGSSSSQGKMSPRNMLVTSIADELRLASNFKSKVVGIAIKDRGAILPAGHSANAAYWYDNSVGKWITSTYYMTSLPNWVNTFNELKLPDQYYKTGWSLLYDSSTYTQSTTDQKSYEAKPFGEGFPYDL
ncbi:MAG: alkaline phosphatase family protein, partial [Bacteroidota bacterium]